MTNFHQYIFEIMLYKNVDIEEIFYNNSVSFLYDGDVIYNLIIELNTSTNQFSFSV
jgi:hypothetical protein